MMCRREANGVLVRKFGGNRPFGRHKSRWEVVKLEYLKNRMGVDCIHLAQNRD
jgi:hypothetical protein